jgi:DNA replication protein DnaC
MSNMTELIAKAKRLGFHGIVAHWDEYSSQPWLPQLLELETEERRLRSFARRIRDARIGRFKPLAEFDWEWPKRIDRELVEELFTFKFLQEAANVVFMAPNGLGKTMLAQNLAYEALLAGHDAKFVKASKLLDELAECDGAHARRRCLRKYSGVDLLVVDEVGYMRYGDHHADLLYEVISERYQNLSTVVTTNKPFKEWGDVFPNAACVVTLVDQLVHKAELVVIEGDSYRQKEAKERLEARETKRKNRQSASAGSAAKARSGGRTCNQLSVRGGAK